MNTSKFWDGDLMVIPTDEIRKKYDLEISGNWITKCPDSIDDRVIVNEYGYRTAKAMRIYYTSTDPLWKSVPDEQRRYKISTRYAKDTDSKKFDQDCLNWYNMKRAKDKFNHIVEKYLWKKSPKFIFELANKWENYEEAKQYKEIENSVNKKISEAIKETDEIPVNLLR